MKTKCYGGPLDGREVTYVPGCKLSIPRYEAATGLFGMFIYKTITTPLGTTILVPDDNDDEKEKENDTQRLS